MNKIFFSIVVIVFVLFMAKKFGEEAYEFRLKDAAFESDCKSNCTIANYIFKNYNFNGQRFYLVYKDVPESYFSQYSVAGDSNAKAHLKISLAGDVYWNFACGDGKEFSGERELGGDYNKKSKKGLMFLFAAKKDMAGCDGGVRIESEYLPELINKLGFSREDVGDFYGFDIDEFPKLDAFARILYMGSLVYFSAWGGALFFFSGAVALVILMLLIIKRKFK